MPDLLQKINVDVTELRDDMAEVKGKIVEHETRFGNGIHVMSELRGEIKVIKNRIEPKAPDWLKLMLAGLSVVSIIMGAQFWLTDRFNDRPTQAEVEKLTAPIKAAQKETARDVGEIQKSQAAQETSIRNIETAQSSQSTKIDKILDRLPAKKGER